MKIKFIFIFGVLIFIVGLFLLKTLSPQKFNKIDNKIYFSLSKLGVLREKTYISEDLEKYIAQEGFDFEKINQEIISDSLNKLYVSKVKELNINTKIPYISHHVYFTEKDNPKEIKKLYLYIIQASIERLNNFGNWKHIFWTNTPEIIPKEIHTLQSVEIKTIAEFDGDALYPVLIKKLSAASNMVGYFAEASDLFRIMALEKFGGIYFDNDYEVYNANFLNKLMMQFDFIGVMGINKYYENGFFAAKPAHPILQKSLELEARNNKLLKNTVIPDFIKYPIDEYRRIYFSGPPLLTAAIVSEYNKEGNSDLILPHHLAFSAPLAQYKNKSCDYAAKMTKEQFIETEKNLNQIIASYTKTIQNSKATIYDKFQPLKPYQDNIYYNPKYFSDFEVIGADMSCGTWTNDPKGFNRIYYWQWPFGVK